MNGKPGEPAMNQKIFSMNLGVETVSLYLLCCAIADAGAAITRANLLLKWNGNPSSLDRELGQLEKRHILGRADERKDGETVYTVLDEKQWF
ncbi:MAG: hypothetical protein PVG51_12250 [Desulfosarcina sp.]|jgi:hypothetical protein